MQNKRLIMMIEASICGAMAMLLDLLPSIKITSVISISFAMVPIFIIALRRGVLAGILSGCVWEVLQFATGDADVLTPVQALIEYGIAFAAIGVAGVLKNSIQNEFAHGRKSKAITLVVTSVFIGSFSRYIWHFIAGFIFWGEYAPKGQSPVLYSLIVNGTTFVLTSILCSVVTGVLLSTAPRLVFPSGKVSKLAA